MAMTEQRTYTWDERDQYDPGECPQCGSANVSVEWKDASTNQEAWLPGRKVCHNPKCSGRPQPEDIFAEPNG